MASAKAPNASGDRPIDKDLWRDYKYPNAKHTEITHRASRALVEKVNAVFPFAEAVSILDIACGNGAVFNELFASGIEVAETAELLGVDISQPMVSQIHERQAAADPADAKTWKRVRAWVEDATNLSSLLTGSQTHVLSQMGIFMFPDYSQALSEAQRVLTPDGIFAMSAMSRSAWNDDVIPIIEKMHPDLQLPRIKEVWQDTKLFQAELEKHEFVKVQVSEVPLSMHFDSPEDLINGLWKALPYLKNTVKGLSEEQIQACKDAMVKKVAEDYPNNELPGIVLMAVARV